MGLVEHTVRALQVGSRLELKDLARADAVARNPLAFRSPDGGFVVLFRTGSAVFFDMTPLAEEQAVANLADRIAGAPSRRETEQARLIVDPTAEDGEVRDGAILLKSDDVDRRILVAEALAASASLAVDERRMQRAFEKIEAIANELLESRLPRGPNADLLAQIGEALLVQQRLAGRADVDDKPDVLWDHPELERLWTRLVDEFDLAQRSRAIARKLDAISDTAETLTDLLATRTSHRLEWYIIALIALEIVLGLYDRFLK